MLPLERMKQVAEQVENKVIDNEPLEFKDTDAWNEAYYEIADEGETFVSDDLQTPEQQLAFVLSFTRHPRQQSDLNTTDYFFPAVTSQEQTTDDLLENLKKAAEHVFLERVYDLLRAKDLYDD